MKSGDLPPLNWLRTFEAAARHLSFTAAADEIGLTQSAVSQQIKSLETFLRAPLFLRRARGLELTDAGRSYLPVLETALAQIADVTRLMRGSDSDAELTIQSNMAFSIHWLAPRIGAFLAANPWVRLNVVNILWPMEEVKPFTCVEIRFGSGLWERPNLQKLSNVSVFPVCAPELATALTIPADVLERPLADCAGVGGGWPGWLRAAGVQAPPGILPVHHASTYVMIFAMVEHGGFVGLGHEIICDDLLNRGRLAKPFEISLPVPEAYYLIPPQSGANAAVEAFTDWLEGQLPGVDRSGAAPS